MANRMSIDEYMALKGKKRSKSRDIEHQIQCECVRWFSLRFPKLKGRLFAVPNGARRSLQTGKRYKDEGMVAGVSDLILLKSNKFYGALLIEMKTPEGKQSRVQKEWQQKVTADGDYKYVVCHSVDEFMKEVENYLIDY